MSATHDLDRLAVVAYQNTREKVYWLKQLAYPVKSFFPYDFYPGTAVKRQPRMERLPLPFSPEVFSRLMALSNGTDVKLNMVLTAAVVVLLHKFTGEKDIITAAPIYRQRVGFEFINTVLPLRHRLIDHMTFKMLLWQVRHTIADAVAHQNFPILLLPSPGLLNLPDSHDPCPLFDVAVLLQNVHDPQYIEHMKHSIAFHFHRTEAGLEGRVFYNGQRYRRESVESLGQWFSRLLKLLIFNVDRELCRVDMLTEEERKKILEDFNDTSMDYPVDSTIDQWFEAQAARTPKHTALIGMEHSLTYRQLNKKANQLARLLRANGVTADTMVALLVEPSLEMIIGMMGILKAGGAYLPIEPDYPEEQIRYILKESRSHILLSLKGLQEVLSVDAAAAGTIYLDDEGIYKGSGANPEKRHISRHLAYVIYTSGTTGRPKGVLVTHGSLAAYVFAFYREFEITEQDCGIQLAPYTFDLFAEELFPLLLKGGKMVIPHAREAVDMDRLAALIKEYRVTLVDTTPLLLNEFNKRASSLGPNSEGPVIRFISGGDVLKHAYVDKLVTIGRVYNTYGPTETTICATYHHYVPGDSNCIIPIGKPIVNYNIYILDEGGALQPVGVPGELYIAGPGLARGYLNQPLLTAEKFPPSSLLSFSASQLLSFSLYCTGDLARWLSDGHIQFLGRKDQQVKIRGFRVELGEIENRLSAHSAVKEAVVTTRISNKGDRYLCAYVVGVAAFGNSPSIAADLKKYLGRLLPHHMIPLCFIPIDRIPLTPNGKIDKNALPEPKITPTAAYVAPRDRVEGAIQKVWQELFDQEKIGIDDDFFELGGHSLTGIQMIHTLHRRFNVRIPLLELFNTRTIRELAEYVTNASRERYTPIEPVETKEYYPLSSAQKRLYVVQQMDLENIAYNMPKVITLDMEKEIHKEKVEQTFEMLIQRHESLRTSFHIINGEPVQRIHGRAVFKIKYYRDGENIIRDFVRPFDLARAPLLRVGLIKTGDSRDVLVIDMHHIITDAVSLQVLVKDFMALYNGEELPPLNLYYKDYCQWWSKRRVRKENALLKQEEYWLQQFSGEIPRLNLPTDFPRPEYPGFEGARIRFELPPQQARALRTLALDNGSTLFMVLLAVYTILLAKLSGQEDIVIGTPASGRQHPDLEFIIGMFINMLALRNYPEDQKTFTAFLEEVKQQTLEAFENQDYPFEDLVDKVVTHRETNRNPLFDCMLALVDTGKDKDESRGTAAEEDIPEEKGESLQYKATTAKFDLTLTGVAAGDDLYFIARYRTRLFKEEKIKMFADHFKKIVSEVLTNPMVTISEISLTSQKEKEEILSQLTMDLRE